MKLKPGKTMSVRDGLDFICPFCRGKCTASEEQLAVFHSLPVCAKYVELSPDMFLQAVNEATAGPI